MTKLIALGMGTFFLWSLTTLSQNAIRTLSELGYLEQAEQMIVPMWLFFFGFVVMLIALLLVALAELRKLSN